jgi:hypothetical protein
LGIKHAPRDPLYNSLTGELRDVRGLSRDEGKRHDTRHVHLRTEHVHVEAELLADVFDVLETFLVVGAGTTDPDLGLVLDEEGCDFPKGADDTLESRGNVGEVGNTTANEEDLALLVLGSTEHEVEDGAGVVESLGLRRSTRVLAVVGKLTSETSRGDGISVDNGSTTTGDESPHTALAVEDGELERRTSLRVHLSNVGLLLAHLATERSRELERRADIDGSLAVLETNGYTESTSTAGDGPLRTALELGGLIDLASKIQEVDLGRGGIVIGNDYQRVDLEVSAMG